MFVIVFFKFLIIDDFDLIIGPKVLPIKKPKFDEFLNPINLNILKRNVININCIIW